jgi:translation initiation factor IF-3
MTVPEALEAAKESGLDLVEVSPNTAPPVCRIMDFGKYKYQASKRAGEAKKKTARVELKEIKFRPKTEEHDFNFKVRNTRRFLESGNKVKITIMFRGREVTHPEFGRILLEKVVAATEDLGQVESKGYMTGRTMSMVLAPVKNKT